MTQEEAEQITGLRARYIPAPDGYTDSGLCAVGDRWRQQLGREYREMQIFAIGDEQHAVIAEMFEVVAYGRDWDEAVEQWRDRNS